MGPSTASEKADRGGLGKMIGLSTGGDEPEHQVDCDGWMELLTKGLEQEGIYFSFLYLLLESELQGRSCFSLGVAYSSYRDPKLTKQFHRTLLNPQPHLFLTRNPHHARHSRCIR
jgi:hypothetical protein